MNFFSLFSTLMGGLLVSPPALAYIDPGTTGTVGGALAAIFPAILVVLGFLVRPVKRGVLFLFRKIKKQKEKTSSSNS